MIRLTIRCVGISPFLMDRMSDAVLDSLATGVRLNVPKDRPAEVVAAEKIYREDGNTGPIGLPAEMIFSCVVNAGRSVKSGKKQLSTATTTSIPEFLAIDDVFVPFENVDPGREKDFWVVDKRRGRLPKDGTALCLIRPKFKEWAFTVHVTMNEKLVSESVVKELFNKAGSGQGLGSFRPSCKGPFGRFVVKDWQSQKIVETEAAAA